MFCSLCRPSGANRGCGIQYHSLRCGLRVFRPPPRAGGGVFTNDVLYATCAGCAADFTICRTFCFAAVDDFFPISYLQHQ